MTTALAKTVYSVEEIERMAVAFHASQLYGFKDKSQYMVLMFKAQAQGRHPALVVDDYHFFSGKAVVKAETALAWHLASGGTVEWIQTSATVVEAKFMHPTGGTFISKWTIEDAKRAGLTGKENWQKYPEDMLTNRVISRGVKKVNPGCLKGEILMTEAEDNPAIVETAAADAPTGPVVRRASEMEPAPAAPDTATAEDAEHAPADAPAAPAKTPTPKAAAPVPAVPQPATAHATPPPTNAIYLKERVKQVQSRDNPVPNAPANQKQRFGIIVEPKMVIGTFDAEAARKVAALAGTDTQVEMAYKVHTSTDGKTRNDLVWLMGEMVA